MIDVTSDRWSLKWSPWRHTDRMRFGHAMNAEDFENDASWRTSSSARDDSRLGSVEIFVDLLCKLIVSCGLVLQLLRFVTFCFQICVRVVPHGFSMSMSLWSRVIIVRAWYSLHTKISRSSSRVITYCASTDYSDSKLFFPTRSDYISLSILLRVVFSKILVLIVGRLLQDKRVPSRQGTCSAYGSHEPTAKDFDFLRTTMHHWVCLSIFNLR